MADNTAKKNIGKEIALDAKSVNRIKNTTIKNIIEMEAKHLQRLSHDFDERYARLIITKGKIVSDQNKILEALRDAFEEIYGDSYNYDTQQYDVEYPTFFDEWDYDLSCGEMIEANPTSTSATALESYADALPPKQTLAKEGELTAWMEQSVIQIENSIGTGISQASEALKQIKAMRDGQIARLQKEIDTIKTERDKAKGEAYSFRDKYEVLTAEYEELQGKENVKNSIDVNTIKANLKNFAENYATSDDTASTKELKQILLWFNEIMEGTAWDAVSVKTIQRELVAIFNKAKKNNQTPMVQGDYVVTKNVENEVKGVAKGATGISVNLRQNNGE